MEIVNSKTMVTARLPGLLQFSYVVLFRGQWTQCKWPTNNKNHVNEVQRKIKWAIGFWIRNYCVRWTHLIIPTNLCIWCRLWNFPFIRTDRIWGINLNDQQVFFCGGELTFTNNKITGRIEMATELPKKVCFLSH